MKKVLSLLLAGALCCGMAACGGEVPKVDNTTAATTAPVAQFMAGFGQGDISCTTPVPIAGGANSSERISTGYQSYLYVHTVAVTDAQGNTALLVSADAIYIKEDMAESVRDWVKKTYGIPQEYVVISGIHQHSVPDAYNTSVPAGAAYHKVLLDGIKDSISNAMEDRAPAEMQINSVNTEAMNFVRNYLCNDGTYMGDNYGSAASGIKAHESEADNQMRLLKFVREGAEDIILVNFQVHPHLGCTGDNRLDVHADWPGVMREQVAKELSCKVIYFSGAGGNMNSISRIASENVSKDYKEHGARAAQYVLDAEGSYTSIGTGSVRAKELTITCESDHSMDHLVDKAKPVHEARSVSTDYANEVMKNYPEIHSVFHATAIVNKAKEGPTRDVVISAVAIGDVVFTAHPYEMFDTNGVELRNGTVGNANYDAASQQENPYAMTFIATLSNGWLGYIPSQLGYTNGGYSTDITKYAPGTGEKLVTEYLTLINSLHE